MSWNYRIIQHKNKEYHIHEVYYDSKGRPIAMTKNPVTPWGESLQELKSDIRLYLKAAQKKPIKITRFEGKKNAKLADND